MRYIKEIGITGSYLFMLIACYFFDWKPYGVFMSYLLEVVVLLIVYAYLRFNDEKKHPERYRKSQPLVNLFIGIVPVVFLQYFLIASMSIILDPEKEFNNESFHLSKEVYYAFPPLVFFYLIKAKQISCSKERIFKFQQNFMFEVLALTAVNLVAFIAVIYLDFTTLISVLTVTVIARILLEFYFTKKLKFI